MRTGQVLFSLEIELGILQILPWKELLATGAQTTCLYVLILEISISRLTSGEVNDGGLQG